MGHSADFLRDEVRNGFYIPTAIKQAWGAALDVLAEIDRICVKHDIRYFADWGTFLGAVRHGGFVPWDDDLDICMLRDDYIKFRAVADEELPKEYMIHDFRRKKDHWLFLSRVVNNSKMCFDEAYLKQHDNFPWLAGVDIFIKDYLYADEEREKERDSRIMKVLALAEGIIDESFSDDTIASGIREINNRYSAGITYGMSRRDTAVALYGLAEKMMSEVKPGETELVGQIFPWVLKNSMASSEPKKYYEKFVRLPFEDTYIPVPAFYNTVLKSRYGDYCVVHKGWAGHGYPFFEAQKADMEQATGEKLPEFSYDPSMTKRPVVDRQDSLKQTLTDCLLELNKLLDSSADGLRKDDSETCIRCMSECQQLAADMGTLVEHVKGEHRQCAINVVASLQEFCDTLWKEASLLEEDTDSRPLKSAYAALENVEKCIRENILKRHEILLLPVGSKEWSGLKGVYEHWCERADTDVYVVPLPLMKKDFFGMVTMTEKEIEDVTAMKDYPPELDCLDWRLYDISIHCPDEVYIQNPYDETNPCLTVPPEFYAKNLRVYAGHLIYIPIASTAEYSENDWPDMYNLKHYVTVPGVIYADEVRVQSENIRTHYINALKRFAGDKSEVSWEEKVTVSECPHSHVEHKEKRLLYCIGINELSEQGEGLVESVRKRFGVFDATDDRLCVSVVFYPDDRSQWQNINRPLADSLFELVDEATSGDRYVLQAVHPGMADALAESFDAYYGSASPFVPAFMSKGKAVMIADYGVE